MIRGKKIKIQSMDTSKIKKELIGLKIDDISVLGCGGIRLFLENSEGRPYLIEFTDNEVFLLKSCTQIEELQGIVGLLTEKLNVDLDKLLDEYYKQVR